MFPRLREILQRLNGTKSVTPPATPDATQPTAPDGTPTPTPTPAAEMGFLKKWALRIIIPLIASGIGALLTWMTGTKVEVQLPVPVVAEQEQKIQQLQMQLEAQSSPINYEGAPFHGDTHEGHHLEAQAARWPTDKLTYSIDYASARKLNPPLSEDAIRTAFRTGIGWWTDGAQLEVAELPHGSPGVLVPIRFGPKDGPGGVLAEAYLADGTLRPKTMLLDSAERWTAGPPAANLVSLPTVISHEWGHILGLTHDSANAAAVMRSSYSSQFPRETARDLERLFQLGYTRRENVPAPADTFSVPVTLKTADVVEGLKKLGYTIQEPK